MNVLQTTEASTSKDYSLVTIQYTIELVGPWKEDGWLGPDFRGLLAYPLKRSWCVWDPPTQAKLYQRCHQCVHQPNCTYAKLLEPEQSQSLERRFPKPHQLIISPAFNQRNLLTLKFINCDAATITAVMEVVRSISDRKSPGRYGISFRIVDQFRNHDHTNTQPLRIDQFDLSRRWQSILQQDPYAVCSEARITADTPLILKKNGSLNLTPTLADLLDASLRTLRQLFNDSEALVESCRDIVPTAEDREALNNLKAQYYNWQPLRTRHHSFRSGDTYRIEGCTGEAVYKKAPIRWLETIALAGLLGIGQNRVSGAGQLSIVVCH